MGLLAALSMAMEDETCITCGIIFWVPSTWKNQRREDHKDFYCPNGHSMAYRESAKERELREQKAANEALRKQLLQKDFSLNAANRMLEDEKRKAASLARRVGNGTCPCCKRTFKQLQRHMECKHPGYSAKGKS